MSGASLTKMTSLLKKQKEQAEGAAFKKINLANIIVNDQVRIEFNKIEELAESIKANGQLQPILVYKSPDELDKFVVIAGERRFRACKLLEAKTIDAIVTEKPKSDYDLSIKQLVENIQRDDLQPLELAKKLQKLVDDGNVQKDIAADIGKSQSYVSKHLQLLSLPEPVKDLMDSGKVTSFTTLNNLNSAYKKNPKEIANLSQKIINEERETITKKESEDLLEKITVKKMAADNKKAAQSKETEGKTEPAKAVVKEYIDVSPSKLIIEVLCSVKTKEGLEEVLEGTLMTDRISLDEKHVWVKTGSGKGQIRTHNIPAENVKILGFRK